VVVVGRLELRDGDYRAELEESKLVNRPHTNSHFRLVVSDLEHVETVSPDISWPQ
jgi:hypothetical protein